MPPLLPLTEVSSPPAGAGTSVPVCGSRQAGQSIVHAVIHLKHIAEVFSGTIRGYAHCEWYLFKVKVQYAVGICHTAQH